MNDTNINDIRILKEFKTLTFSEYKKSDVCKQLIISINTNDLEPALNWSAELICSGSYIELWEILILIISKHIHLANPKLAIYLDNRFDKFKQIIENGYIDNELALRNNKNIRELFCEIIIILCISEKKPSFEQIKISNDEYNLNNISNKLNAPNISFGKYFFKDNDPKEVFVAINELAYNLYHKNKNLLKAHYWIEWIVNYDTKCRRSKNQLICGSRSHIPVHSKFHTDVVWIVWDIILLYSNNFNKIIKKILASLLNLFCLKYTFSCKKKRKYILYFACELITEYVNITIPISNNNNKIKPIINKINNVYKLIKKNEQSPKTEYLFGSIQKPEKSNLDKTIEKMDILNNIKN